MNKKEERSIKAAWNRKVKLMNSAPPESFENFINMSEALSTLQGTTVMEAAKKRLNSISYTSYERRVHNNLTGVLKEEGMTSRLYRMGGKTKFENSEYDYFYDEKILRKKGQKIRKPAEKRIHGKIYIAKDYYNMGGVKVIFWTSKDDSSTQYIEFNNGKTKWLQARKGEKMV